MCMGRHLMLSCLQLQALGRLEDITDGLICVLLCGRQR